jgi:hypothetical protein
MKKRIAVLAALVLVAALAGCGRSNSGDDSVAQTSVQESATPGPQEMPMDIPDPEELTQSKTAEAETGLESNTQAQTENVNQGDTVRRVSVATDVDTAPGDSQGQPTATAAPDDSQGTDTQPDETQSAQEPTATTVPADSQETDTQPYEEQPVQRPAAAAAVPQATEQPLLGSPSQPIELPMDVVEY